MNIWLFDMDGVLLESLGYHRALQETVRLAGAALGFRDAALSMEEIAAFESVQVTSEWDSAAICTALLLVESWQRDPARRLPGKKLEAEDIIQDLPRPDFKTFAMQLGRDDLAQLTPLQRAEQLLLNQRVILPGQSAYLKELFALARTSASVLYRTFQELALGSVEYMAVYGRMDGIHAQYNTPSYLQLYDRPMLSAASRAALLGWLSQPGCSAALMTSRPSRPPARVFGTPEAELGLQLVGEGTRLASLPISGWGSLCWIADQFGSEPQGFVKPDPTHALVGLQLAMGTGQEEAGKRAYTLSRFGQVHASWQALKGSRVTVFEDTRGGLLSLLRAASLLENAGIKIAVHQVGIAHQLVKVKALEACGARVYPDLDEALSQIIP